VGIGACTTRSRRSSLRARLRDLEWCRFRRLLGGAGGGHCLLLRVRRPCRQKERASHAQQIVVPTTHRTCPALPRSPPCRTARGESDHQPQCRAPTAGDVNWPQMTEEPPLLISAVDAPFEHRSGNDFSQYWGETLIGYD